MSPSTVRPTILIVDDVKILRSSLRRILEPAYRCLEAATAAEASDIVGREDVNLVLLDLGLPDRDGIDWLQEYMRSTVHGAVIVVSGSIDRPASLEAMRSGAVSFLPKPFTPAALREAVSAALLRVRAGARPSTHQSA